MKGLSLYSTGDWGGKPHFECNCCARTSFEENVMQDHIRLTHGHQSALTEQYESVMSSFTGRVMLSAIFWRNDETARDTMAGLLAEALRLMCRSVDTAICIASGETSVEFELLLDALRLSCKHYDIPFVSWRSRINVGSSKLRNFIARESRGYDYVMFTDGDIEIVPYSTGAMIALLESNKILGCVGAYSNSYSNQRQECTAEAHAIPSCLLRTTPFIAWTQYGMFRQQVFYSCKFEESGPFDGPGWGFEDDDMAMQMRATGWEIANFRGMRYLHRDRSSSLKSLQMAGHDPKVMFEERKAFFLAKWKGFSHNVAGMQYPDGRA